MHRRVVATMTAAALVAGVGVAWWQWPASKHPAETVRTQAAPTDTSNEGAATSEAIGSTTSAPRPGAAATARAPIAPVNFVVKGTLPELPGPATVWKVPAAAADRAAVAALATSFGFTAAQIAAWKGIDTPIGATDGTGPTLWIGGAQWSYSTNVAMTGVACAEAGGVPTTVPGGTSPCPTVPAPAGVPAADEAQKLARERWSARGLDLTQYRIEVVGDAYGRTVQADRLLDGQPSGLREVLGYGAGGQISYAGGSFGTPVKDRELPRTGVATALDRLRSGTRGGVKVPLGTVPIEPNGGAGGGTTGSVGSSGSAAGAAGSTGSNATVTAPAGPDVIAVPVGPPTAAGPVSPPATGVDQPAPVPAPGEPTTTIADPGTGLPPSTTLADGGPVTTYQPPTVELVGVTAGWMLQSDTSGALWLLPTYVFASADGGSYPVVAVDDSFIAAVTPMPAAADAGVPNQPMPHPNATVVAPGTPVGPPVTVGPASTTAG